MLIKINRLIREVMNFSKILSTFEIFQTQTINI